MGTEMGQMLAVEVDGARVHAGVSFLRLSEASGIPLDSLADLLDGKVDFTLIDLANIATVLGVPVTQLLPAAVGDS